MSGVSEGNDETRQHIAQQCARAADPSLVIAATRRWLGTPYHDQASSIRVGCDCLGLVRGVWREVVGDEPFLVPPYSRDWGETGTSEVLADAARAIMIERPVTDLRPGALILFRMRDRAVAKHCGIVAEGAATFIHAYERLGVIKERITAAWKRRIAYQFMFPGRGAIPEEVGTGSASGIATNEDL